MSNPNVQVFSSEKYSDYLKLHKESKDSLESSILKGGFQSLASNFITNEVAISFGKTSVIGTVNEKEYDNSPMCSPFNLFCLYPKKKIRTLKITWLKHLLHAGTSLFSLTFKAAKFDRVIQLNNKPCDAITYPNLSLHNVKSLVERLKLKFPQHAIIFPRIDPITSPVLFENLKKSHFLMIPTRTVHIYHPDGGYMKRRDTKRDFSLLKKCDYHFVSHKELNQKDIQRIYELYKLLFLEKHGKENPALTLEFFQKSHLHHWYTFFSFRNREGVIDAFSSYETRDNIMACGPLGYDTKKKQECGLYRLLFAKSLQIAHERRYICNFGGGNEPFKMNRGSQRVIGYTAVYCDHLPLLYRRLPWLLLENLGRSLTLKILAKTTF